jgi:hypothetical protein
MPKGCVLMAGILTILHMQAKPKERRTGTIVGGLKENENLRSHLRSCLSLSRTMKNPELQKI